MNANITQADALAMDRLIAWVDAIDVPMFLLVPEPGDRLEYAHANGAFGRATGIAPENLVGRTAAEVFPARTAARMDANHRQCLAASGPVSCEECVHLGAHATWWQTTLSKPAGFDNAVILGVAVTITERKARDFAAAEALAALTEKFDDLRLFSTMAAHDARSPLATVSDLIGIVLDGFKDMGDGKPELLRLVSETVREALTQITATLERGRGLRHGPATQARVDLDSLCGDIAAMVDPEMSLTIDTPELTVICDEVVVQIGVRNLMANAARFCRSRIAVEVREGQQPGQLVIDVVDDGPGLPDGTTLGDLTKRGENRDGSHGFGLTSIAHLLGSRGGTLELCATSGHSALSGARFRMILPGRIEAREDGIFAATSAMNAAGTAGAV